MRKRTILIFFGLLFPLSVLGFLATGYSTEENGTNLTSTKGTVQSITPQQAQKLIEERPNLIILDVRTPQELKEGFIEGSEFFDFWALVKGKHNLPRNRPLLLVCAVGGRSYFAGVMLTRAGYSEVYNLNGGISGWKDAGLPVHR